MKSLVVSGMASTYLFLWIPEVQTYLPTYHDNVLNSFYYASCVCVETWHVRLCQGLESPKESRKFTLGLESCDQVHDSSTAVNCYLIMQLKYMSLSILFYKLCSAFMFPYFLHVLNPKLRKFILNCF